MTCVVPAKIDTLNGEIRSTEMTDLYKMDKTYIAESFVRAGINDPIYIIPPFGFKCELFRSYPPKIASYLGQYCISRCPILMAC